MGRFFQIKEQPSKGTLFSNDFCRSCNFSKGCLSLLKITATSLWGISSTLELLAILRRVFLKNSLATYFCLFHLTVARTCVTSALLSPWVTFYQTRRSKLRFITEYYRRLEDTNRLSFCFAVANSL